MGQIVPQIKHLTPGCLANPEASLILWIVEAKMEKFSSGADGCVVTTTTSQRPPHISLRS